MSVINRYFRAASAAAFSLAFAQTLVAQEQPRVNGTITLSEPSEAVEVMANRRARLGVVVLVEANPPTDSIGAVLVAVTPNGPAYRAGLRGGDIITRFNGQGVFVTATTASTRPQVSVPGIRLVELASALAPGDSGTVQYRRGSQNRQCTVVAGDDPSGNWTLSLRTQTLPGGRLTLTPSQPAQPFESWNSVITTDTFMFRADSMRMPAPIVRSLPRTRVYSEAFVLGSPLAKVELVPLNPKLGRYFGTTEGVLVINLPEDSKLGLQPGDVVLAVDKREVRSPNVLIRTLTSYEPGQTFTLQIYRNKSKMSVTGTIVDEYPGR